MSTLVDHQIQTLIQFKNLIEPYKDWLINPASYDVTLGSKILVETPNGWDSLDITEHHYPLKPNEFVLAHTDEFVRIPSDLECTFQLKSSRGREGFNHMLAGYIDPGFHGRITLELSNVTKYKTLVLYKGLRIGQLRFSKLHGVPLKPYNITGRYHNDDTVQSSKG